MTTVRPAVETDLVAIAELGSKAFSGLNPPTLGESWVRACWSAHPRMLYWVAEDRKEIRGYILWVEKGGFRKEAVLELEQIAVDAAFRRKGIGTTLVRESLKGLRSILHDRGSSLKLIEVTTGTEQGAVDFYRRTLGAELVARLPDVFRGDEIVLFARPPRA